MMVNAPGGWGLGNSGNAYMQWYQPLDKNENYRTLVNSHLTWLVEFGWPLRFVYILGWGLIFLICWPSHIARWRSVALGAWLCFFGAAFFSSVGEAPAMWIVPVGFLFAALANRLIKRQLPTPRGFAIPVGATLLVCSTIWLAGSQASPLQKSGQTVIYDDRGTPQTVAIYDSTTMGSLYGKSIRSSEKSSIELVLSEGDLPSTKGKTLLIGGTLPKINSNSLKHAIQECRELVLLSPKFFPREIGINESNKSKVITYFGDFSQSACIDAWQSASKFQQLAGVGDFIPNWPTLLSEKSLDYGKR
jgi:hypothetical protein